jgi:hypothetical protein
MCEHRVMQGDATSFSHIGSLVVHFDSSYVNIGPAPDLILVHFTAVCATTKGPYFQSADLTEGYEDVAFRADGIVTYRGCYFLSVDGIDPFLLTYSGMSDVGEDAYEEMLDDILPGAARIDASAQFFASALKHRPLNRIRCRVYGERDFRGAFAACEFFAHGIDWGERP